MIAFVFDRRSLVLLGTGAVFLALVLVAVGFLLGVQYGVLPPASQSTTAQANFPALPTRVTGMADDATGANTPEPDPGVGSTDAEPTEGYGAGPESLPYADAPAGVAPSLDESASTLSASPPSWPAPRASAEPGRTRTPAAAPRFDPPADPIVDSRGGEPVPLAPSPQSVPDRPSRDREPQAEREAPGDSGAPAAPTSISAAVDSDAGRFAVQVGAYRERLNCDAMVQKLTSRGFEPYVVEIVRDGKSPLYAVRVGRFGERGTAAKAASALRSKAGVPVVVLSIG